MITEAHIDQAIAAARQGHLDGHTYNQSNWCGTACCVLGFARICAGEPEVNCGPRPGEIEDTPRTRILAALMRNKSPAILDLMERVQPDGSLVFPETWNGDNLYLDGLRSAKGLVLPGKWKGNLYLDSLRSAKGLVLPGTWNGDDLNLDSLTSAKGLVLPGTWKGNLYLSSLRSAKGLVLPDTWKGGEIYFDGAYRTIKYMRGLQGQKENQ